MTPEADRPFPSTPLEIKFWNASHDQLFLIFTLLHRIFLTGSTQRKINPKRLFSLFLSFFILQQLHAKTPEFIWSDALWRLSRFPSYSSFFKELSNQGYTGVDLEIIEPNSNFHFYSPTLAKLNWNQQPDILTEVLQE